MVRGLFLKMRDGVTKTGISLIRRERFGATVLTIKRKSEEEGDRVAYLVPKPATTIAQGDALIIFGPQKDLSRFPRE